MANERAKQKIEQLEQAQSVIGKILDHATWASDIGDFPDISRVFDNIAEAAETAMEEIENKLTYLRDQLDEFEDKHNEFLDENEVEVD